LSFSLSLAELLEEEELEEELLLEDSFGEVDDEDSAASSFSNTGSEGIALLASWEGWHENGVV
jgi:hypothetical protein